MYVTSKWLTCGDTGGGRQSQTHGEDPLHAHVDDDPLHVHVGMEQTMDRGGQS
ncbi:hypothetical protein QFZ63_006914 [Streptomyces sp. B3I7]|uniref:hypothetical protein n=1 Tax=Streptomyces sp. B3I7 TaxID=3042269 RepID=UPI002787B32E|nr:hypothetical protein [Streptomyces sp. B3I7]MDQ0815200.1 hypothetical protein [Streptomyces sp. B3I7]